MQCFFRLPPASATAVPRAVCARLPMPRSAFRGSRYRSLARGSAQRRVRFHRLSAPRWSHPSAFAPRPDRYRSHSDARRAGCRPSAAQFARRSDIARRTRSAATATEKQTSPSGTAETRVHERQLRCGRSCHWRRHDCQPMGSPVRLARITQDRYRLMMGMRAAKTISKGEQQQQRD